MLSTLPSSREREGRDGELKPQAMEYHDIKTLKGQVGWILETRPETRNSDAELVTIVSSKYGHDPIKKATSIERCRRWLNQRNKYLPTLESVARHRKMNIDEWKVAMGYPTSAGSYQPPSALEVKIYRVRSKRDPMQIYLVRDWGSDRLTCTCNGFKYRQDCAHKKHIEREKEKRQILQLAL